MYGPGETAKVYMAAIPQAPLVVQREYDGFKAEVGQTISYAQAISWVKEYGLHNTADYYATIRVIREGVTLETYDFPPGAHTAYKGD